MALTKKNALARIALLGVVIKAARRIVTAIENDAIGEGAGAELIDAFAALDAFDVEHARELAD